VIETANPATGEPLASHTPHSDAEIEAALAQAHAAHRAWRDVPFPRRATVLRRAAALLRDGRAGHAELITREMGKPIAESEAEIDKCAWGCEFYAEHAEAFLADRMIESTAERSFVAYQPVGVVLAVMPWNFPFWQVLRFAAPALMAGNGAVLKHSPNVSGCALAVEALLRDAGAPEGLFRTLLVEEPDVPAVTARLIEDPRIGAVTLTGSERAGASVGAAAGRAIKKSVLELGGSDPFVVLADADVAATAAMAARSRFLNGGQSCIAAKRFIVLDGVADEFRARFAEAVGALRIGDPLDRGTDVGPLARADLLDALERQVEESVAAGATVVCGGARLDRPGWFFAPTVLTDVTPEMPVFRQETFGPVAAVVRARDEDHAVELANDTAYGLGATVWTRDVERGARLGRRIESGALFVNGVVASDPRLPFGGTKRSGYGRELSAEGIREFANVRTFWLGPADLAGVEAPRSE
jgi:succinate-semialdehyde dehydrogenase/glutarate-semialdehyde dehydrogenase